MNTPLIVGCASVILDGRPETFIVHGNTTYDDTEELIELLERRGVEATPEVVFQRRENGQGQDCGVNLRVKLHLKYP